MRKERQNKYNERFDAKGYKGTKMHTNIICTDKKPGHQDGATRSNPIGGSTLNKKDVPEPDVKDGGSLTC